MTARSEIENGLGRAAWGDDENDAALIAAQFAEAATITMRIGRDGGLIGPFEGRAAGRELPYAASATGTAPTSRRRRFASGGCGPATSPRGTRTPPCAASTAPRT